MVRRLTELMSTSGMDMGGAFDVPTTERRFNLGPAQRHRFWQRRSDSRDQTSAMRAVHAPLAGDMCEVSADLLFGEDGQPDLIVESTDAQATLEDAVEKVALWSRLLEGAETAAAMGGVYLRPLWDTTVADHALSSVVGQEQAVPDFRFGQLVAVTFWEDVASDGLSVIRHLERHEPGVILHGLYQGTATTLGNKIGLRSHPSTADLDEAVPLPEGIPRPLLVSYVPNVLPNRRRRKKPIGRSDFAGAESFLDALDERWTSLMRDGRLGQARIIAPDEFLQAAGTRPGDGKTLDVDRELFTGLNIAEMEKLTEPIKLIQPDLRTAAHLEVILELVKEIVSAGGWSPQTFGLDIDGQAESGTALRVKYKKTLNTVKLKRGYFGPAVADHTENLLAINASLFGGPAPERPRLDWPDMTDDPVEIATTTGLWHSAQAISLWERVKARNPHWDDTEVQEEVDRILEEKAAAMPVMDLPPTAEPDEEDEQ